MVLGHQLGHFAHRDQLRGDASIFKSIVASSVRAISQALYS